LRGKTKIESGIGKWAKRIFMSGNFQMLFLAKPQRKTGIEAA